MLIDKHYYTKLDLNSLLRIINSNINNPENATSILNY